MRHSISLSVFQSQQIAFWWLLVPVEFLEFIHNEEWMEPAGNKTGLEKHELCRPKATCFPPKLLRCPLQKLVLPAEVAEMIPLLGMEALSTGME